VARVDALGDPLEADDFDERPELVLLDAVAVVGPEAAEDLLVRRRAVLVRRLERDDVGRPALGLGARGELVGRRRDVAVVDVERRRRKVGGLDERRAVARGDAHVEPERVVEPVLARRRVAPVVRVDEDDATAVEEARASARRALELGEVLDERRDGRELADELGAVEAGDLLQRLVEVE